MQGNLFKSEDLKIKFLVSQKIVIEEWVIQFVCGDNLLAATELTTVENSIFLLHLTFALMACFT